MAVVVLLSIVFPSVRVEPDGVDSAGSDPPGAARGYAVLCFLTYLIVLLIGLRGRLSCKFQYIKGDIDPAYK